MLWRFVYRKPVDLRLSRKGLNLIKHYEGVRLTAYKAVSTEQYYTIGYGDYGPHVQKGQTITLEEAERRLRKRIAREFAPAVRSGLKRRANQNHFDAMVSLAYNIGTGNFSRSSVLRHYNAGRRRKARQAFLMWVYSSGTWLRGLYYRRRSEQHLYRYGRNRWFN